MAQVKIDLTQPDPRSESVVIETPAGTLTVTVGLVGPGPDSRERVRIQLDESENWATTIKDDDIFGEVEIIQQRDS